MRAAPFSEAEVLKTIAKIIEHGTVFEVRALEAQLFGNRRIGTVSGYFDSADACICELQKLTAAKGVYITANPVNPALLARRTNRLDYAEKNATTSDQHILHRRWLPIDVDPDRPSGISSSRKEKEAAKDKAREIYRYLKRDGWPEPIVADSGNGFHLLYRLDVSLDDGGLVESVLAVLAHRFDGGGVKLDRSVHNAARIVRLYGTLAAKGDNTEERPHRLSKIIRTPQALDVVTPRLLRALVDELQPEKPATVAPPAADNRAFDIEGFLARHGIEVAEKGVEPKGTIKWRLKQCPFNPDHETPDAAVFQSPDGKLGFKCFHNSCQDKHWKDFRRHFEPARIEGEPTWKGNNDDDAEKAARKSAATRLVELASAFTFFHDPQDRPFVRLEIHGHTEIWPVESTKFRKLLARTYYEKTKKAINRNALSDAITTLAGKACHDGNEEPVFLRVAPHSENILIDLCDERWRVVEISASGWRILGKSPVAFVRTGSMQALPEPVHDAAIGPLWDLLNVTKAQRPLVMGTLVNYFHPYGPYFVLNFVGEQGTAKTCAARIIRQLVDPNENPLRSPPREERDLLAQAANNWCVALDNLSSLPPWQSDALCRLATGGGHSARTLYTDLEEISLAVKRPVILNGIEDVASRPDLAERALQIELETIPEHRRIPERELCQKFDVACRQIFSAILDGLVCALGELSKLKIKSLPRMADAALWATAGETAFGFRRGAFMAAYRRNLDESAITSVEAHPVGVAILQLLEKRLEWSGEATQLLQELNGLLSEEQRREKNWPKNARSLGHCLSRLAPAIRHAGIGVDRGKGKRREIRLCKARRKTSQTSKTSSEPKSRDNGDVSDVLSGDLLGVEEALRL
jgi:hypothetical protein